MTPRITFGIIVLNGEPFTRHNLRSLYPWANQIVVVEGACPAAAGIAGTSGHSTDGTLELLRKFQAEEDPEGKLSVVIAEDEGHPDGFWSEKDEMSQAYANRATGEFLWQVDIDEFYSPADMPAILEALEHADAVTFPTLHFWGGLEYVADGFHYRCRRGREYHRLFRWGPGYTYACHRPPTVLDERGRDLRSLRWLPAQAMERQGIVMYHYCYLLPKSVREKADYYSHVAWDDFREARTWAANAYGRLEHPYRVLRDYHSWSWLDRYVGGHPPEVVEMVGQLRRAPDDGCELRPVADIEDLLSRRSYRAGRACLKALVAPATAAVRTRQLVRGFLAKGPLSGPAERAWAAYNSRSRFRNRGPGGENGR